MMRHKDHAIQLVKQRKIQVGRLSEERMRARIKELEEEAGWRTQKKKRKVLERMVNKEKEKLRQIAKKAREVGYIAPLIEVKLHVTFPDSEEPLVVNIRNLTPLMMGELEMPNGLRTEVIKTQMIIDDVEEMREKIIRGANRELLKLEREMQV